MSVLLAGALQAAVIFSESLALPLPDKAEIAARCESPLVERIGASPDGFGEMYLSLDMDDFQTVMAELDAALAARGWPVTSIEGHGRTYMNDDPPGGCRQGLIIPAPAAQGVRESTDADARPFDGAGYLLFLPVVSEPECDFT
ncbi:hypothetical protein ACWCOP_00140 [Maricaulaceae bacterium MS644]